MRLWLLRREPAPPNTLYDAWYGFVVRAETEEAARAIAHKQAHSMGYTFADETVWSDPAKSTCRELTTDGPAEVILEDFASG